MAELPQGARPLYRILAEKSRMGFGRHADCTVSDLLKIGQESYLVWAYYNLSNISFKDEILGRLGVMKIPKPGTDERQWISYLKGRKVERYTGLSNEEFMHRRLHEKAQNRHHDMARCIREERKCEKSAAYLQAVNHGHIKDCY